MKFSLAITTALIAIAGSVQAQNWTNCATGPTVLTVTSTSLAPPLCPGTPSCLTLQGSLSSAVIEGAKLSITGRYLGRLVYTHSADLCTLLAEQGTPCPVATTATSIKVCPITKPNIMIRIPMAFTYVMTNGDGSVVACQAATLTADNYCNPPASTTAATVAPTTTTTVAPITTTTTATATATPTVPPMNVWTNCATGATSFTVTSTELAPPLCATDPSCITLQGTLSTPIIEGAKLQITGRYLGRLIYNNNADLCTLLAEQGTPCPVATTATTLKVCPITRNIAPNLGILHRYYYVNGDGGVIACQTASLAAVNCHPQPTTTAISTVRPTTTTTTTTKTTTTSASPSPTKAPIPPSASFTLCASTDDFDLTEVKTELAPADICTGTKACIVYKGSLRKPLQVGTKLKVFDPMYESLTYEFDLCAILKTQGKNCPIPAGPVSFKVCEVPVMPTDMFAAAHWDRFRFFNPNNTVIACSDSKIIGKKCAA